MSPAFPLLFPRYPDSNIPNHSGVDRAARFHPQPSFVSSEPRGRRGYLPPGIATSTASAPSRPAKRDTKYPASAFARSSSLSPGWRSSRHSKPHLHVTFASPPASPISPSTSPLQDPPSLHHHDHHDHHQHHQPYNQHPIPPSPTHHPLPQQQQQQPQPQPQPHLHPPFPRRHPQHPPQTFHSLLTYTPSHPFPVAYDVIFPPSAALLAQHSRRTLAAPATAPPCHTLTLHNDWLPWPIVVRPSPPPPPSPYTLSAASSSSPVITVYDVLAALHVELQHSLSRAEWAALDRHQQHRVARAFQERCRRRPLRHGADPVHAHDHPMGDGVRRIDWLVGRTLFVGLEADGRHVNAIFEKPLKSSRR